MSFRNRFRIKGKPLYLNSSKDLFWLIVEDGFLDVRVGLLARAVEGLGHAPVVVKHAA